MKNLSEHDRGRFVLGVAASPALLRAVRALMTDVPEVHLEAITLASLTARKGTTPVIQLLAVEVRDDGSELLSALPELRRRFPDQTVVAISAVPEHRAAVRLIQAGARDYVVLTAEQHRLYDLVDRLLNEHGSRVAQQAYVQAQSRTFDFDHIVGRSGALRSTLSLARKVADNAGLTVLILGETGTGKGLLAKAVHYNSPSREQPFVEIGCTALPETLLESELFGHEKGAFTDARQRKAGLFEIAGSGTIFLDEIGDISPAVQSKLLKVLEEKTMRRVGGIQDIRVQARIIAATSRDLGLLVQQGRFRKDLFYRLNVLPLVLPPLRERREDIPLLIDHFLRQYGTLAGRDGLHLTPEALQLLNEHAWEGNVRELMHVLERAVVLSDDDEIGSEYFELSAPALQVESAEAAVPLPAIAEMLTLRLPVQHATIDEAEKHLVRQVLEHVHGNKSRAAALLQISRPRLERILRHDRDFFKDVLPK